MKKPVQCNKCGSGWHYTSMCPRNRKPIPVSKPLPRATTPIKKAGKHTKQVNAAVAKWKRGQQPNHEGYWECYMCHKWIPYLIAEHVKSKVRHRDLATDPTNLKPTCDDCNRSKGSKDN